MLNFFLYVSLTMFITWVIQKMKLFDHLFNLWIFQLLKFNNFLNDLRRCRLCLGYWVAIGLYFIFGQRTFIDVIWIDVWLVALLIDYLAYYAGEGIARDHFIMRV